MLATLLDVLTKQIVRKPQSDTRELIEQYHRKDNDCQIRQNTFEDIHQFNLVFQNTFQIISRHRHWRCQEGGLQVKRHQHRKEIRINTKIIEHRQEDWHKDNQNFRPLKRPTQNKDDELNKHQELPRCQIK